MRMKVSEKIYNRLNDEFSDSLDNRFLEVFGIKVETIWDIFDMQKITLREDRKPLTVEQHAWIGAFAEGYQCAMKVVEL